MFRTRSGSLSISHTKFQKIGTPFTYLQPESQKGTPFPYRCLKNVPCIVVLWGVSLLPVWELWKCASLLILHHYVFSVAYSTLTETYNSLSNDDIQGILVDAYVAGSAEQIRRQPENTYVNRIIGKSISYGMVLSGRLTRLGEDCREYIKQNQAKIAKLVTVFVKPIDVRCLSNIDTSYMQSFEQI